MSERLIYIKLWSASNHNEERVLRTRMSYNQIVNWVRWAYRNTKIYKGFSLSFAKKERYFSF